MPVRKRTTTSSSPLTETGDEARETVPGGNSRSSSSFQTDNRWKRRRHEVSSFAIGHRVRNDNDKGGLYDTSIITQDIFNLDPHVDDEDHSKDEDYQTGHGRGEQEESDSLFEAHSESSSSVISVGDDSDYEKDDETHDDDEGEEDIDGSTDDEEQRYGLQDGPGDGSEVDEDERYARLLQQQEIALARSYFQDGFLGQELVAAMVAASEDSSVDMSYEALLELEENLGEVKRRGLEEHTLQSLPRQLHTEKAHFGWEGDERRCAVCLVDYELGDELASLPCTHSFHAACAIRWLKQRATCPVCRETVPDAPLCIDLS